MGGGGVKMAVEAQRQLACVLLRGPWRMALMDMAEGEEGDAGDGEEAADECEQGQMESDQV
jgi:hypothetical protein